MPQRLGAVLAVSSVFALASRGGAQTCIDTAGFVRTFGKDTLGVERVEVTPQTVRGTQRSTGGVVQYSFVSRGLTVVLQIRIWSGGAQYPLAEPTQSGELVIAGSRATFTARQGDSSQVQENHVTPGVFPLLDAAVGLEEAMIRAARRTSGGREIVVPTIYVASDGYTPRVRIKFVADDSVNMAIGSDMAVGLKIDSVGRVLRGWYRSPAGDLKARVTRVSCAESEALIAKAR